MPTPQINVNYNDTTPAAPGGGTNVKWQKDAQNPENISAYIPPGGGGAGPVFSPDTPPVSPTAWDDEFNGLTFNPSALWTTHFAANVAATVANSWLRLFGQTALGIAWMAQAVPGSTPWEFAAKLSMESPVVLAGSGGLVSGGLVISDGTKLLTFYFSVGNPNASLSPAVANALTVIGWTSSAFTNYGGTFLLTQPTNTSPNLGYMKVRNDGTNLIFLFSNNGIFYQPVYTVAVGSAYCTPSFVGISLFPYNPVAPESGAIVAADWFRRTA